MTKSRKALLDAYKASYDEIPETVQCAACGALLRKVEGERHHPAGRRKQSFCFTVIIHPSCHKRVHDNPAWATACGLLWTGRNSKVLSMANAVTLVKSMPFTPLYAIDILRKYQFQ